MTGTQRPKVVVAFRLADSLLELLAEFEVIVFPDGRTDDAQFIEALKDADGLLVNSHVLVDLVAISAAPKLRVISTMSVGVDHIDVAAAHERGITVTIAAVLSDAVADLTVALMTMLARRIPEGIDAVASGCWNEGSAMLGGDLAQKVLLLVGFGRIGQAVASRALAAKMQVVYVDSRESLPDVAGVSRVDSLGEGLRIADFVSLHVDLNAKTGNLMGPEEFAMMKSTAFFVNTSRGGVVDQEALTAALSSGQIAGAGLDVLRDEPPRTDDPLLTAPNVIVVPHIGSATFETRAAMARCAVENLLKILHGEEALFVV